MLFLLCCIAQQAAPSPLLSSDIRAETREGSGDHDADYDRSLPLMVERLDWSHSTATWLMERLEWSKEHSTAPTMSPSPDPAPAVELEPPSKSILEDGDKVLHSQMPIVPFLRGGVRPGHIESKEQITFESLNPNGSIESKAPFLQGHAPTTIEAPPSYFAEEDDILSPVGKKLAAQKEQIEFLKKNLLKERGLLKRRSRLAEHQRLAKEVQSLAKEVQSLYDELTDLRRSVREASRPLLVASDLLSLFLVSAVVTALCMRKKTLFKPPKDGG